MWIGLSIGGFGRTSVGSVQSRWALTSGQRTERHMTDSTVPSVGLNHASGVPNPGFLVHVQRNGGVTESPTHSLGKLLRIKL